MPNKKKKAPITLVKVNGLNDLLAQYVKDGCKINDEFKIKVRECYSLEFTNTFRPQTILPADKQGSHVIAYEFVVRLLKKIFLKHVAPERELRFKISEFMAELKFLRMRVRALMVMFSLVEPGSVFGSGMTVDENINITMQKLFEDGAKDYKDKEFEVIENEMLAFYKNYSNMEIDPELVDVRIFIMKANYFFEFAARMIELYLNADNKEPFVCFASANFKDPPSQGSDVKSALDCLERFEKSFKESNKHAEESTGLICDDDTVVSSIFKLFWFPYILRNEMLPIKNMSDIKSGHFRNKQYAYYKDYVAEWPGSSSHGYFKAQSSFLRYGYRDNNLNTLCFEVTKFLLLVFIMYDFINSNKNFRKRIAMGIIAKIVDSWSLNDDNVIELQRSSQLAKLSKDIKNVDTLKQHIYDSFKMIFCLNNKLDLSTLSRKHSLLKMPDAETNNFFSLNVQLNIEEKQTHKKPLVMVEYLKSQAGYVTGKLTGVLSRESMIWLLKHASGDKKYEHASFSSRNTDSIADLVGLAFDDDEERIESTTEEMIASKISSEFLRSPKKSLTDCSPNNPPHRKSSYTEYKYHGHCDFHLSKNDNKYKPTN